MITHPMVFGQHRILTIIQQAQAADHETAALDHALPLPSIVINLAPGVETMAAEMKGTVVDPHRLCTKQISIATFLAKTLAPSLYRSSIPYQTH